MTTFGALALHDTLTMSAWHRSLDIQYSRDTTMLLTLANVSGKLVSLANKETHEFGNGETDHLCTGMDATRKDKAKRNTVSLRCQMDCWKNQMALHRRCLSSGKVEQRRDTRKTDQLGVIPKNALAPPSGTNRFDGASKEQGNVDTLPRASLCSNQ